MGVSSRRAAHPGFSIENGISCTLKFEGHKLVHIGGYKFSSANLGCVVRNHQRDSERYTDYTTDLITPINNLYRNFKVNKTTTKKKYISNRTLNNYKTIHIFTDGSKDQEGMTGYGIYFQNSNIEQIARKMENDKSIFQAEACAIKTANRKLIEKVRKANK